MTKFKVLVRVVQLPSSRTHSLLPVPDLPTTSNQELHATHHTSSIVASS